MMDTKSRKKITIKKSTLVQLLTFIGPFILFVSWISQNYLASKWQAQRLYLEKTQLLIQIEQNNAEMWQIQLINEISKEPKNKELLLSASYNFLHSITKLIAWEESRVTEGSTAPIQVKNLTHDVADQLLKKKDLLKLLELCRITIDTKSQFQSKLDKRYFEMMTESKKQTEKWNNIFLIFYIIGSILIAFRWILTNIYLYPEKSEILNK